MIVCICKNISDKEIKAELNNGINSLCDLKRALGVATKCVMCECEVKQLVCTDKNNQEQATFSAPSVNNGAFVPA